MQSQLKKRILRQSISWPVRYRPVYSRIEALIDLLSISYENRRVFICTFVVLRTPSSSSAMSGSLPKSMISVFHILSAGSTLGELSVLRLFNGLSVPVFLHKSQYQRIVVQYEGSSFTTKTILKLSRDTSLGRLSALIRIAALENRFNGVFQGTHLLAGILNAYRQLVVMLMLTYLPIYLSSQRASRIVAFELCRFTREQIDRTTSSTSLWILITSLTSTRPLD